MELSIPPGVSTIRGGGFPCRECIVTVLTMMAPNALRSKKRVNSVPYPKVPEAVITGFFMAIPAIVTPSFGRLLDDGSAEPSGRASGRGLAEGRRPTRLRLSSAECPDDRRRPLAFREP